MSVESEQRPESQRVPRTLLAIAAGWFLPGLGHLMLGRVRRGLLFAGLLIGAYGLGLAHDGRLALRDERQPFLSSLQVIANAGIGPADMVARLFVYGKLVYSMPRGIQGGVKNKHSETFRERTRSALSIYGTAYVWTAGLMNLLLLFDIWDIGMARKP
jgi:hypothetical protein